MPSPIRIGPDMLPIVVLMSTRHRVLKFQAVARQFRLDAAMNFHARKAARLFVKSPFISKIYLEISLRISQKIDGPNLIIFGSITRINLYNTSVVKKSKYIHTFG